MADNSPVVQVTQKVFETALTAMRRFVSPQSTDPVTQMEFGHRQMKRIGKSRPVSYLISDDGSGARLRIEVYTLDPKEPDEEVITVDA